MESYRTTTYSPLPRSEGDTSGSKMTCKGKYVFLGCCIGILIILFVVFLALYLDIKYSDPAAQVEMCRSELQNQTSLANDGMASLQRRLKALAKAEKAATAVAEELRTQKMTAEQGFVQTKKHWESCQNQLKTLVQNFTAEMGNAAQREAEKCQAETDNLQRQLSNQAEKLEEALQKNQQQREDCDARIHQLQAEQKHQSPSSGAAVPETPIAAILTFAFLFLP
ncbi:uncharacterized protein [Anolis sagrei]|uniref:uncharacterized protein n=1 Tax=Anolis sagrei TaxID=38937 RepID=UPI003520E26A